MDGQPAAGPAVPNERKNSKAVRRARTAAATAARKRAATDGAPYPDDAFYDMSVDVQCEVCSTFPEDD